MSTLPSVRFPLFTHFSSLLFCFKRNFPSISFHLPMYIILCIFQDSLSAIPHTLIQSAYFRLTPRAMSNSLCSSCSLKPLTMMLLPFRLTTLITTNLTPSISPSSSTTAFHPRNALILGLYGSSSQQPASQQSKSADGEQLLPRLL